jgi:hypothetical protein
MHLEKEERYMEIVEAVLVTVEEKYFIDILEDPKISIPISDDDPNAVKSAFNFLIERLKKGMFTISLNDTDKDLFYHVAVEYIEQLNGELKTVYQEMEQNGFVDDGAKES